MDDCLFCRIIAEEIPADVVHRDSEFVAFRDIDPQAPVHVLVTPVKHYKDALTFAAADPRSAGRLLELAGRLAVDLELADAGYRFVLNTGFQGGQSVDHVHLHLLGGRQMLWPPG